MRISDWSADVCSADLAGIGWTEALAARGMRDVGLELDWAACKTRIGAGHTTIQCDVTQYPTWVFKGRTTGGNPVETCPKCWVKPVHRSTCDSTSEIGQASCGGRGGQ